MKEFDHVGLGCKFTVPDPLCLRDVEAYEAARDAARDAGAQSGFSINWCGALALIQNWECEAIPDPSKLVGADLGDSTGTAMQVVVWVAGVVNVYVLHTITVPKN